MEHISVEDAQERLADLVEAALRGERVVIESDASQLVQLIPVNKCTGPRKPGSARGIITMSADFDAPLEDFDPYT